MDIALHSICQPGRPGPQGESHFTSPSASSQAFHNAKSPMCSLSYSSCFTRAANRLVLHIRDVHHAMHLVAAQFQVPLKQILKDVRAEISNVRPAINGRPARVHSDWARARIAWLEFLNFAGVGIEEAKSH